MEDVVAGRSSRINIADLIFLCGSHRIYAMAFLGQLPDPRLRYSGISECYGNCRSFISNVQKFTRRYFSILLILDVLTN